MKVTAKSHIPVETYGFIELSYEPDSLGMVPVNSERIISDYNQIKEDFKNIQ